MPLVQEGKQFLDPLGQIVAYKIKKQLPRLPYNQKSNNISGCYNKYQLNTNNNAPGSSTLMEVSNTQ